MGSDGGSEGVELAEVAHGASAKRRRRVGPADVAFLAAGAGRPVLLLHGFPTHAFLWRHVMRALATDVQALAPDLPGLGDTEVSPYEDFTLAMQAETVVELLDGAGADRAVLVGHGVGAGVAQIVAALHPGRVAALVLVAPASGGDGSVPEVRRLARLARTPGLRAVGRLGLPAALRSLRFGMGRGAWSDAGLPAGALEEYARPLRTPLGWMRFLRFVASLDDRFVASARERLRERPPPTLVVCGADDPYVSEGRARQLAAELGARLRVLGWCGHWVPEERPAELAAEIRELLVRPPEE